MSVWHLLFSFEGRIDQVRFWLIYLPIYGLSVLLVYGPLLSNIGLIFAGPVYVIPFVLQVATANVGAGKVGGVFMMIACMCLLWVSLVLIVKRYHDRNKSGWWALIACVPIVGSFWQFIELGFFRGTGGSNRFGPDPLKSLRTLEHRLQNRRLGLVLGMLFIGLCIISLAAIIFSS